MDLSPSQPLELVVAPEQSGWRLDVFLASHFPAYSRVHLRRVITAGGVTIDRSQGGSPPTGSIPASGSWSCSRRSRARPRSRKTSPWRSSTRTTGWR